MYSTQSLENREKEMSRHMPALIINSKGVFFPSVVETCHIAIKSESNNMPK